VLNLKHIQTLNGKQNGMECSECALNDNVKYNSSKKALTERCEPSAIDVVDRRGEPGSGILRYREQERILEARDCRQVKNLAGYHPVFSRSGSHAGACQDVQCEPKLMTNEK
jgi:hypothetical protein